MRKLAFLLLVFLSCSVPLRAQWSGGVDLSAGFGGMRSDEVNDEVPMFHGLTQGVFLLNYKSDQFTWNNRVEGKWEPKTTETFRASYKNEKLGAVYKASGTMPLSAGVRSDFSWTPSRERRFSAWLSYQYKHDQGENHTVSLNEDYSENAQRFSYYYELPKMDEHKVGAGFNTFRSLNGGQSILQSSFSFQATGNQKVNTWIVLKAGDDAASDGTGTMLDVEDMTGYAWRYRITPSNLDLQLDGDIHFQQTVLEATTPMKLTGGMRVAALQTLDRNSGATHTDVLSESDSEEYWRDSLRLRESFNYLVVRTEPYVGVDFKWESVEAHADYAGQVFARRLNDDTHAQPLRIKGVYPVGKAQVKWTLSPNHILTFRNVLSVSHPDYLKICWYDRTAGYLDQLYRGNEHLISPRTRLYGVDYRYTHNRFFSQTGVSYRNVKDEIDQTWSNMVIEGREYKVFEWLNAADSRSVGLSQALGWRGKVITANAGVTYNQSLRTARSTGEVKKSFDWKLTTDVAADLGKGWTVGADAKYQSKVATFFTIFKGYCELNAYVQKKFKKFTLYLRERELLDQKTESNFWSEEMQEFWTEEVRLNRRISVLGIKWAF